MAGAGGRVRGEPLDSSHTPEAVAQRLEAGPRLSYVRDLVYGAIDGTVTTFAVVAGARGASLGTTIVVILGAANLIADGFSMAASNYLGIRSDQQRQSRIRKEEIDHISRVPEGEREEVRQIYAAKGLEGEVLDGVVDALTSDRVRWLETMLAEEHGLPRQRLSPLRSAVATFMAFVTIGVVPILPYGVEVVFDAPLAAPFAWSVTLTAVTFVAVGVARAIVAQIPRWRGGAETLALGGAAALLAFAAGSILQDLV